MPHCYCYMSHRDVTGAAILRSCRLARWPFLFAKPRAILRVGAPAHAAVLAC